MYCLFNGTIYATYGAQFIYKYFTLLLYRLDRSETTNDHKENWEN